MTSPSAAPPRHHAIGYNLATIAIVLLLLGVGLAYLVDGIERSGRAAAPDPADQHLVQLTLSGQDLSIPASWFRTPGGAQQGFTSQVDLTLALQSADGTRTFPVEVTLLPRSRARPSSVLLDGVYLHQFAPQSLGDIPGLVGKPLTGDSGYSGETVWYDALSPEPFVAKCQAPVEARRDGRCLRTVYLRSGIAAVYSFDTGALADWHSFDTQMRHWLNQIGAI